MKNIKGIILTAMTAVACAGMASAQVFTVTSPRLVEGVTAESAAISADGAFVVASTTDGLQRIDFADLTARVVGQAPGATKLTVSDDGSSVAYRVNHYDADGMRTVSLECMTLADGAATTIVPATRHLAAGVTMKKGHITAVADGQAVVADLGNPKAGGLARRLKTADAAATVAIDYGHLVITAADGQTRVLDPLGTGSYLWPSVSPDGQRVLFHFVGGGTYTCALDGTDVRHLSRQLVMPVWAGNDAVIGSVTTDDGLVFLTGTLTAVSLTTGATQALTPDSVIALDPVVSADGRHAAFTTPRGQLYTLTLTR